MSGAKEEHPESEAKASTESTWNSDDIVYVEGILMGHAAESQEQWAISSGAVVFV